MNHLKSKSPNSLVELSAEECKSVSGGDNITQAVFRYLGSFWAGIEAGQPHASYGYYAGMNTK
ncbi:hypothetical protein [Algoriphagus alkaliphilus]|nr:hypothetical protein [Algoriphagus alkaliphilus]